MKPLRIALAQVNSTVGDLDGNTAKIFDFMRRARRARADVIAFPELAITGYPPEDLVLKPQFVEDNIARMRHISERTEGIVAFVGFVDADRRGRIYNAAALVANRRIVDVYHKIILPNFGVFDEYRYFTAGKRCPVYEIHGARVGINICEDIWADRGPVRKQSRAGAELIININASPYERGKLQRREELLTRRSSESSAMIAYLNAVGGQDELVFDGSTLVYDHEGRMMCRGRQFEEDLILLDLDMDSTRGFRRKRGFTSPGSRGSGRGGVIQVDVPGQGDRKPVKKRGISRTPGREEEVYGALVLGTGDYVVKNGFRGVVVGLSGGVDSSLVATVAVDALGKESVHGLFMPSQFTSGESREDAYALGRNLGITITEIRIDQILEGYLGALEDVFRGRERDVTEENLQARIRGNLLMALSNKFGWLVLTTGNKSEMSVGYATLYGDMAGGFAVIKDVPKTLVYELCSWRNSRGTRPPVPERVLWKEPTAELRPDQKDTDTLPPYQELDPILRAYIEEEKNFRDILKVGCELECTRKVIRMVDLSEYKRRQAPPGIKITSRAFGRDRRFPITNKYRSY